MYRGIRCLLVVLSTKASAKVVVPSRRDDVLRDQLLALCLLPPSYSDLLGIRFRTGHTPWGNSQMKALSVVQSCLALPACVSTAVALVSPADLTIPEPEAVVVDSAPLRPGIMVAEPYGMPVLVPDLSRYTMPVAQPGREYDMPTAAPPLWLVPPQDDTES